MSQFVHPTYGQQPPPDSRPRNSSNASMNRYVPEEYGGPPPARPPAQAGYIDSSQPQGPSVGTAPVPIIPPVPNHAQHAPPGPVVPQGQVYGSSPGSRSLNGQLHPSAAEGVPPYPTTSVDRDGYIQPPKPRRESHSSTHSHWSHKSHHSHHSRHSHDSHPSRRSGRSSHSQERERRHSDYDDLRRSHESKRSHHGDRDRDLELKRQKTHRPSWGDTIYSMFSVIKDALGPRDKY